jgi:prepilin signal peptidase PulO-like enzyme (type II secretory pathway)
MNYVFSLFIFITGLCFGSFVNMLVYRKALKYDLKKNKITKKILSSKKSFCDYCGKELKWFENIPVFSWFIQKGKTRCCNKKLSKSYPFVELLTASLFLVLDQKYSLVSALIENFGWITWVRIIFAVLFITLLVFSFVFDYKYLILPDFSTIILIIIAFLGVVFDEKDLLPYLLSALGASAFLLTLNLITKDKGMGMGDVKFAIFMGLFLGFPNIIVAFYVAFVLGAIVGLFLMLFGRANKKSQIAFGPFLIIGLFVAWWWGELIVKLVGL